VVNVRKNETRRFTIAELKEYDGKDGRPAYSAFRGKVFDVSNSPFWKKGKHTGVHSAGLDLTESMMNAPHSETVFSKFQIVGELVLEESTRKNGIKKLQEFFYDFRHIREESSRKKVVQRLQELHIHPVMVHFSVAIPVLALLFSFLFVSSLIRIFVFTVEISFDIASYYLLFLGLFANIAGGISGVFSWKVTYEGRMTKTFSRKILYTIAAIIVNIICLIWRIIDPNILALETTVRYIYLALVGLLVFIVFILGHDGGKIVYS
jgi:predicted heme/steroid binding protein/uncharacterized membrane protein